MNMKKRGILLFCVLASMLLIIGCKKQAITGPRFDPFIGGKEGLHMSWVDGEPPETVLDKGRQPFGIGVKLDNIGEEYIGQGAGYVEIIGINPKDFNKNGQADLRKFIPIPLREAKRSIDGTKIEGGQTVVEFTDLKYLPLLQGDTPMTTRANLCYDYRTKTSTKICAKKELIEVGKSKICDISGPKEPKNSGGPVQITSVKESPLGEGKIQLTFEIEHTGDKNNLIFKRGTECDDKIENPNRNVVYVRVTSDVYGKKADCGGAGFEDPDADSQGGYINLYGGQKRVLTCTYDISEISSGSVFEPLFNVDLFYRYHQYMERPIVIKAVGR